MHRQTFSTLAKPLFTNWMTFDDPGVDLRPWRPRIIAPWAKLRLANQATAPGFPEPSPSRGLGTVRRTAWIQPQPANEAAEGTSTTAAMGRKKDPFFLFQGTEFRTGRANVVLLLLDALDAASLTFLAGGRGQQGRRSAREGSLHEL